MSLLKVNSIGAYSGTVVTFIDDVSFAGSFITESISATTYNNLPIGVIITGGTYNNGTATFTNNTGGTFTVSGFYSGGVNLFTTGSTGNFSIKASNDSLLDASGNYSFAEGFNTIASGIASHAEGNATTASGTNSHAEGSFTTASGNHSHAEGNITTASGTRAHAEGNSTLASGAYSHAEGNSATSSAYGSHSEGYRTTASGNYSHAEGGYSTASGDYSHSEGVSVASGTYSHAEGYSNTSSAYGSHAEGGFTTASNYYSHAEGKYTTASGDRSHAEGYNTTANGIISHAEGKNTTASGYVSHAEGSYTTAISNYSHAEGNQTLASGNSSHAEGKNTTASGNQSHAEGVYTTASGYVSHAEGYYTTTSGYYSHSEGMNTISSGVVSHTEGYGTTASGNYSHAEGFNTIASGATSHAEGSFTTALGDNSHAEGGNTTALGDNSHSEGYDTKATSNYSHAEGYNTTASGMFGAHSGGFNTAALGNYSFVHGFSSKALASGSIVLGTSITGSSSNTVYVNNLVINNLTTGTSISSLGVNNDGKIISGNTNISDAIYTVNSDLSAENTTSATTSVMVYGVNVFSGVTATDFATKLPQPVTGKSVKVINNGSTLLHIFPSNVGGRVNNLPIDTPAVIPPDGNLYEFICIKNPLPGEWTFSAPATGQYDSGEISVSISANTSGGGNPWVTMIDSERYGMITSSFIGSWAYDGKNKAPKSTLPVYGALYTYDYALIFRPETPWKGIHKIKVYTNLITSLDEFGEEVGDGEIRLQAAGEYTLHALDANSTAITNGYNNTNTLFRIYLDKKISGTAVTGSTIYTSANIGDAGTLWTEAVAYTPGKQSNVSIGNDVEGTFIGNKSMGNILYPYDNPMYIGETVEDFYSSYLSFQLLPLAYTNYGVIPDLKVRFIIEYYQ